MSIYFPVVADSRNVVSPSEKAKALRGRKLRNLLLANAVYKEATVQTLSYTKKVTTNLLKKVDEELAKE